MTIGRASAGPTGARARADMSSRRCGREVSTRRWCRGRKVWMRRWCCGKVPAATHGRGAHVHPAATANVSATATAAVGEGEARAGGCDEQGKRRGAGQ